MQAKVICRVRPGVTQRFNVRGEEALIGREPGMAVAIPLEGVSRQHARIVWDGKTYWIEDLKSTNGTFLNGDLVSRDRLRHLDVISLGKKVDLIFVLRSEESQPVKRQGIVRAVLVPEAADALPHEMGMGEVTLGRSSANNVVAESGAVSKVHARIERTVDQLIVQDLGSANGTFVNGTRVMTAPLKDGDVVSLAGVASYRVEVQLGEVTSSSGVFRTPSATNPSASAERPRFSGEWKTRFDWDSGEMEALADLQQVVRDASTVKHKTTRPAAATSTEDARKPAAGAPEKGAGAPAKAPVAGRSVPPARPAPATPAAPPAAAPAGPPVAPARVPPEKAGPPAPKAEPAAAAERPLKEVRLTGGDEVLAVSEPGSYDLGRSREIPLRVNHPTVSRRHARIILSGDRMSAYIEDGGGANGTRLNGALVETRKSLADGDVIGIGELELRVSLKRA